MARQSVERYMPDERRPSPCGCAADENDSAYMQSFYDIRGVPVHVYGGSRTDDSSKNYNMGTAMTMVIVALVALIVGYICCKLKIPMRFFNKGGGGDGGDIPQ